MSTINGKLGNNIFCIQTKSVLYILYIQYFVFSDENTNTRKLHKIDEIVILFSYLLPVDCLFFLHFFK